MSIQVVLILFLLVVFACGAISIASGGLNVMETMETNPTGAEPPSEPDTSCPDILVQTGDSLTLYNSRQPQVEGVNPIRFKSLDDYIRHLETQRASGIVCPVLFMRKENNAQGQDVYRVQPSPFQLEGGVPQISFGPQTGGTGIVEVQDASRDNPPYNQDMFPGFDPTSMYVGKVTNLDVVHESTNSGNCSANAADPKWCGPIYTNQEINRGVYSGSEVYKVASQSRRPR